ncbi:MAG TPA: hypothetical protein VF631_08495 [Allosphingosinicella sp.]|jgi:spermidine synthase|uniref:hypothetical protein n=1 Tax=Allosphingosinicella sp. TaxID=2823234 RepID=UPI002F2A4745
MTAMFEEIDHRDTRIGVLSLRRRRLTRDSKDIWEIKLDEGYLMSSQFVEGEIALATLALSMVAGDRLRIVVGGLGLGYTAKAALDDPRVAHLSVIELIPEVIGWHREHLLPLGQALTSDPRCTLKEGDFFALSQADEGFGDEAGQLQDAILVDIDHSTTHLIHEASAAFYQTSAIASMIRKLRPGGVFALWSSDEISQEFLATMRAALTDVRAERVEFYNPYRDEPGFNIIYIGRRA